MKGNIMDKKILLSGAAAIVMGVGIVAAPAQASIDLSIGGEASVSLTMNDKCADTQQTADDLDDIIDFIDTKYTDGNTAVTTKATFDAVLDDINTNITLEGASAGVGITADVTFKDYNCDSGDDATGEDGPELGWGKELSIGASGTLANGLSVSFSDTLDLTNTDDKIGNFNMKFGGAFGTLTVKDGAPSAVTSALVGDTSGRSVTGFNDWEGHTSSAKTAGLGGTGIMYQAPSMGNMDLYVSWAPNKGDDGLDDQEWQDTFGVGLTFTAGDFTIGGGMESASAETACSNTYTVDNATNVTAQTLYDQVFDGELACGDQTATAIGATFTAGGVDLSAAWSSRDTDEADLTTLSAGMSTDVGEYSLSVDWANTVKEYGLNSVEDEQTIIGATVSTALGDGVDLGLSFSTNDVSLASEEFGDGHDGDTNNYKAQAKITVSF
jgi:hypothetical protein